METLKQKSISDLPDEVIKRIFGFLSYHDLLKLRKQNKRLKDCAKRVSKKYYFVKLNVKDLFCTKRI